MGYSRQSDDRIDHLSRNDRSKMSNAVQFLLHHLGERGMVREDQLKRFITHNQLQMNDSTEMVIDQLKQNLKEDFGIEIIVAVSNRVNWLVGKNTMNFDELFAVVCNDVMNDEEQKKERLKKGFLNSVLMYLYMGCNPANETKIAHEQVMEFINQFEPAISERIGPVQSLIAPNHLAEFIWKGWIAYESEVLQDSTVANFYSWGPRAKATIDRMNQWK